ncbi:MAG: Crp/Fnr family transcriptional regulator [Firmicutes bacterium]|nr:Crp/Fnr family transcriptional regulator [Bacillota bacterium]
MLLTKSQQETVRKCFLFEGLTAEDIDGMMEELSARRFRGGEPIYTPEEYEKALGIVTEGEVCVLKPGGAQLNVIHKGGCFGAAALFDENQPAFRYVTTLIAHKTCQVIFISAAQLTEWFDRYPQMAMNYIRFLSGRIRFLNRRIDSFTSPSSEEALLKHLRVSAGQDGIVRVQGGYAKLARTLSMSRATLYRALARLEEEGSIQKEGNTIRLTEERTCGQLQSSIEGEKNK